jgi:hypothetical protein
MILNAMRTKFTLTLAKMKEVTGISVTVFRGLNVNFFSRMFAYIRKNV